MSDSECAVDVQLAHVTDRLVTDYAGQVPDAVVRSTVSEVYRGYAQARVTQFLPVLVDRSVRQRLGHASRRTA